MFYYIPRPLFLPSPPCARRRPSWPRLLRPTALSSRCGAQRRPRWHRPQASGSNARSCFKPRSDPTALSYPFIHTNDIRHTESLTFHAFPVCIARTSGGLKRAGAGGRHRCGRGCGRSRLRCGVGDRPAEGGAQGLGGKSRCSSHRGRGA